MTGEVVLRDGEEHIGLLQAMMTSGVQTVVASLWRVDDAATRALFEAFYVTQTNIHSSAQAMKDASDLLRQQETTLKQLSEYRLIIQNTYPEKAIECYIFWTTNLKLAKISNKPLANKKTPNT